MTTERVETPHRLNALSFAELRRANASRVVRWHIEGSEPWTGADWGLAMGGECGEAQNVVKKLRRIETGAVLGIYDRPKNELLDALAEELADTLIYADLLAQFYGIDLGAAVVAKFNRKSVEQGFPERLTPDTAVGTTP